MTRSLASWPGTWKENTGILDTKTSEAETYEWTYGNVPEVSRVYYHILTYFRKHLSWKNQWTMNLPVNVSHAFSLAAPELA